jgi:RNA polymerase sigma-70 factor (ECF subfamily)
MAVSRPSPSSAIRSKRPAVTESPGSHLSTEDTSATPVITVDLARRATGGDREALEQLLLEAQAVAWRFSRTVCGHTEDAEDAMQEALVQTFRYISRLRDPEAFRPWLYRMVRNACLMSRRRRVGEPRHLLPLEDLLPAQDPTRHVDAPAVEKNPEQLVVNAALRRHLARALAKLPPAFRMIVFLREMEGLSTREAAAAIGVSEDTVKARLHRARLFLQRELAATEGRAAGRRGSGKRRRTSGGAPR